MLDDPSTVQQQDASAAAAALLREERAQKTASNREQARCRSLSPIPSTQFVMEATTRRIDDEPLTALPPPAPATPAPATAVSTPPSAVNSRRLLAVTATCGSACSAARGRAGSASDPALIRFFTALLAMGVTHGHKPFAWAELQQEYQKIDVNGEEVIPTWVEANRRLAYKKEKNEHWSVVRALVKECRDRWPKDERCLRAALRAFLAHAIPLPYWLHAKYIKDNAGGYCRLLIDYGGEEAMKTALAVLYDCHKRDVDRVIDASIRTLLPHIVTEVMTLAKKETSTDTRMLLDKLQSMVKTHPKRATTFATAAKLSWIID